MLASDHRRHHKHVDHAWDDQRLSDTARSDGSILQVMAQPLSGVSFLSSFSDFVRQ
jgi:hypothetical protein